MKSHMNGMNSSCVSISRLNQNEEEKKLELSSTRLELEEDYYNYKASEKRDVTNGPIASIACKMLLLLYGMEAKNEAKFKQKNSMRTNGSL